MIEKQPFIGEKLTLPNNKRGPENILKKLLNKKIKQCITTAISGT